jgi:predicted RNA-binding Zn-ribbon protein involved in translation (DUF1610 family)
MNKSEAGKLGYLKSKDVFKAKQQQRLEEYNKNPKKCKHCGEPLPYEKRRNSYCNSSCSAKSNNKCRVLRKEINTFTCLNCGKEGLGNHGANKFCNNKCQAEYYNKQRIKEWKEGRLTGIVGDYGLAQFIRKYMLEKAHYKCERCGWGEKNPYTGKYVLEIHHKDGDYTNNTEENLEVLCLNCHGMTENYKSRNKNGRKGRKKYSE